MAGKDDVLAVIRGMGMGDLPDGYAACDDPDVLTDDEGRIIGLRNPAANPLTDAMAGPQTDEPTRRDQPVEPEGERPSESLLWPEIRMLIENGIRNQPRERQVEIGPSELGTDCLHCLAAKLAGWPETKQVGWIPFIGTCLHEHFERMFGKLGEETPVETTDPTGQTVRLPRFETEKRVTVGQLNGIYGHTELHGSIDLYDRRTHSTCDWKLVGNTTLTNAKANGPSQQYRIQASLYGIGLENGGEECERNCIYMLPKNSTSLADTIAWETPFDPKPGRWAIARAQLLVNLMDCIEQADGPEIRDAWIHRLPTSPTHCFRCGSWPDDQLGDLTELNDTQYPDVPDKWETLTRLLEATYQQ